MLEFIKYGDVYRLHAVGLYVEEHSYLGKYFEMHHHTTCSTENPLKLLKKYIFKNIFKYGFFSSNGRKKIGSFSGKDHDLNKMKLYEVRTEQKQTAYP